MKGIAYLFPGNFSICEGMLAPFDARAEPGTDPLEPLHLASEVAGTDLVKMARTGPGPELCRDPLASLAVLAADVAAFRLLERMGIAPVALAGYGPGYYAAAVAAGVIPLETALAIAAEEQRIGWEVLGDREFGMLAVEGFTPDQVEDLLGDLLRSQAISLAAQDGPRSCTLAGEVDAVRAAGDRLAEHDVQVEALPRGLPRQTPSMLPVPARLCDAFGKLPVEDPQTPLYSHFDGSLVLRGWQAKDLMIKQMVYPLRWEQCVRGLMSNGIDTFVEVGPGDRLSRLVREIDPGAKVFQTATPEAVHRLRASVSAWTY